MGDPAIKKQKQEKKRKEFFSIDVNLNVIGFLGMCVYKQIFYLRNF